MTEQRMGGTYYRLNDDHSVTALEQPTVPETVGLWDMEARRVAESKIQPGDWLVSTVFLVIMHPGGLFETMIFGKETDDEWQWRYETYADAVAGHEQVVRMVETVPPEEWSYDIMPPRTIL